MTAKNRARPLPVPEDYAATTLPVPAAPKLVPTPLISPSRSSLQRSACPSEIQPRRVTRVPTHAVGVHPEHREYPRATLKLPLRLRSINNTPEEFPVTLVTRDISSTGVYFLCPKPLPAGAAVELEIVLVSRPLGQGNVVLATHAHVQRVEPAAMPGWYGIAASYDDVQFGRDDSIPSR